MANFSDLTSPVRDALRSRYATEKQALEALGTHVRHLWLKRLGWIVACLACLAVGFVVGAAI